MRVETGCCEIECDCQRTTHSAGLVVITGGPGAGKTAIIEMARKKFCRHVALLPEAASLIFQGGFWRLPSVTARRAAQRAIYHVQREMERLVIEEGSWGLALCDRGSLDGLAYWPGEEAEYWSQLGSDLDSELKRYAAVIHLRTPTLSNGYNHQNRLRIETVEEALAIDERIAKVWSSHPRYAQIESSTDFLLKAQAALQLISDDVPQCCRPK